jgi:hypothetical protein
MNTTVLGEYKASSDIEYFSVIRRLEALLAEWLEEKRKSDSCDAQGSCIGDPITPILGIRGFV